MGISLILSPQWLLGWTVENKEDYLERNMQEMLHKQRGLKTSLNPEKQDRTWNNLDSSLILLDIRRKEAKAQSGLQDFNIIACLSKV